MQKVLENRQKYCNKQGYTCINGNTLIDKTRPAAWSKILVAKHYLNLYDYVMYVDMDIVILDMTRRVEDFIAHSAARSVGREIYFIATEDWSGLNTGVFIARSSPFTRWLLAALWTEGEAFLGKYSPEGVRYPFEYEQRVFHYLLQTDLWTRRRLPVYSQSPGGYSTEEIRSHFSILPQCAFNSYAIHPFSLKGDRAVSHYKKGDFLIHFAGKKGRAKTDLMRHYLALSECAVLGREAVVVGTTVLCDK
jgi:hypothetical protein